MKLFKRKGWVVFAVVLLSSCGLVAPDSPPPACPEVVILADAAEMNRFVGQGRDLTDLSFKASVNNFVLDCLWREETAQLESRLTIRFEAEQGPANTESKGKLEYFVAVVRPKGQILNRESFDLVFPFQGTQTVVVDNVFPNFPLRAGETGADFVIYLGLVLSEAELSYNRSKRASNRK